MLSASADDDDAATVVAAAAAAAAQCIYSLASGKRRFEMDGAGDVPGDVGVEGMCLFVRDNQWAASAA